MNRDRELEVLQAVAEGADVYAYELAVDLREIERESPGLIFICEPKDAPQGGTERQPYFGCIATDAGRARIRALIDGRDCVTRRDLHQAEIEAAKQRGLQIKSVDCPHCDDEHEVEVHPGQDRPAECPNCGRFYYLFINADGSAYAYCNHRQTERSA